ncbi:MAG: RiPP maturation radical SAM C-methyltransferase [Leptospirales bacterium]
MTVTNNSPLVTLVTMPFAELATPSAAIGILKAELNRGNIETEVIEGQILFSERIGPGAYTSIKSGLMLLLGDWIFSKVAFPDFEPNEDQYLQRVGAILRPNAPKQLVEDLQNMRAEAALFVEDIAQRIVSSKPKIVACTSVFQQHCASIALLRRVKELKPEIVTVIGGSNCESEMGKATLVNFDWIDVVVSGDADDLITPLCQSLIELGPDQPAENLPVGVFAHDHRRRWLAGESLQITRRVFQDMDRSPVPDYDSYFDTLKSSLSSSVIFPGLPVETSRGCWWGQKVQCTFCGIESESMKFRSKSADRVMAELKELVDKYRIPRIKTVDLILDVNYFKDLIPRLAETSRDYKIFYEVRANLSRERMKALRNAGIMWIQPGFESLHDEALSRIHKGTTAVMNVQSLKWAREQGIWVIWSILTKLPGEQDEWYSDMTKVCRLLTHLQPPMPWNAIAYHRFSPYHQAPENFGLELVASWMYYYVYPLSVEAMQNLAYELQDVSGMNLPKGSPPEIDPFVLDQQLGKEAEKLLEVIAQWRGCFFSDNPAIMTLQDHGDHGTIHDTRPCATQEHVTLTGNAYRIYRYCEGARTREAILRKLEVSSHGAVITENELDQILEELMERQLLILISNRYLALAIDGQPRELPDNREYPEGSVVAQYDDIIIAGSSSQ